MDDKRVTPPDERELAHLSKVRDHADVQIHELAMEQDKNILTFAGLFLGGISFLIKDVFPTSPLLITLVGLVYALLATSCLVCLHNQGVSVGHRKRMDELVLNRMQGKVSWKGLKKDPQLIAIDRKLDANNKTVFACLTVAVVLFGPVYGLSSIESRAKAVHGSFNDTKPRANDKQDSRSEPLKTQGKKDDS